jgi:hypothetical protein
MDGKHPDITIDDAGELHCPRFVQEGDELPEEDTETLPLF